MEKEWIAIIGTLAGVLFGGAISSVSKLFELRHQSRQDDKKLLLSKLEELHERILDFTLHCTGYSFGVLQLTDSEISLEKYLLVANNLLLPMPKITSMVRLYAPEHLGNWKNISNSVKNLHEYGANYYSSEDKNPEKFQAYMQPILDECEILLTKIEKKTQITITKTG